MCFKDVCVTHPALSAMPLWAKVICLKTCEIMSYNNSLQWYTLVGKKISSDSNHILNQAVSAATP